jgi:hypothetical protein
MLDPPQYVRTETLDSLVTRIIEVCMPPAPFKPEDAPFSVDLSEYPITELLRYEIADRVGIEPGLVAKQE